MYDRRYNPRNARNRLVIDSNRISAGFISEIVNQIHLGLFDLNYLKHLHLSQFISINSKIFFNI